MYGLPLTQPTSSSSILIVDDQPGNLLALSRILEQAGFIVRQALNGKIALQTIQVNPPDLILLDIRMPELDGYEVCSRLKANQITRHIPIIFLSVLDDVLDKVRAFAMGGVDYITKPFYVEEVLARVQHQLTIQTQQQRLMQLNQQLNQLNQNLEQQLQAQTLELREALMLEQSLKRISDQVRDTLDQNQILQTAVRELAQGEGITACDAVLYNSDRLTSALRYRYVQPDQVSLEELPFYMTDAPEIYAQLTQKYWFAFCERHAAGEQDRFAILTCPIFDDQVEQHGILGDLQLFKPASSRFDEQEIHLLEQVANQCAVGLRQARLYEAAQRQVDELERLHRLKDDFLSTISHELKSPLANMKMALQLLDILAQGGHTLIPQLSQPLSSNQKAQQYFEILKQECDRELNLVQDLLDLQYLEADVVPLEYNTIQLHTWLPHALEPFQLRMRDQQQRLVLNIQPVPPVTLDLPSFSRVVSELLHNAYKYTPAQGTITAGLEVVGDRLEFSVANTGIEIAPDQLRRIFDKFYRIANNDPWKYGGTGLGLALVQKLVERLHGNIRVTSRNHVTCFTVELPLDTRSLP